MAGQVGNVIVTHSTATFRAGQLASLHGVVGDDINAAVKPPKPPDPPEGAPPEVESDGGAEGLLPELPKRSRVIIKGNARTRPAYFGLLLLRSSARNKKRMCL